MSVNYHGEIGPKGYIAFWAMCSRAREKRHANKLMQCAQRFHELYPNDVNARIALIHARIANGIFDAAKRDICELIAADEGYSVYLVDLYYAIKDFEQASIIYDSYKLAKGEDFVRPQFDYRKASAYYHTHQEVKWRRIAKNIGRRLAWDKFYRLNYLALENVERIPEIDEYIRSVPARQLLLDFERMALYLRRLPRIAWTTFVWYRYYIILAMFLLGIVLAAVVLLLKLFFAEPPTPGTFA